MIFQNTETKTQSKSWAYDKERFTRDEFYKKSKHARSSLSHAFRRWLLGSKRIFRNSRLAKLLGMPAHAAFYLMCKAAEREGFSPERYGIDFEIDHIMPVSSFKESSKVIGADTALEQAFNWRNLRVTKKRTNRRKGSKIMKKSGVA